VRIEVEEIRGGGKGRREEGKKGRRKEVKGSEKTSE